MKSLRLDGKEALRFAPRPYGSVSGDQEAFLALCLCQTGPERSHSGPDACAGLPRPNMLSFQSADQVLFLDSTLQCLACQVFTLLGQGTPGAVLPERGLILVLVQLTCQ